MEICPLFQKLSFSKVHSYTRKSVKFQNTIIVKKINFKVEVLHKKGYVT